jgi:hypothetical protein
MSHLFTCIEYLHGTAHLHSSGDKISPDLVKIIIYMILETGIIGLFDFRIMPQL